MGETARGTEDRQSATQRPVPKKPARTWVANVRQPEPCKVWGGRRSLPSGDAATSAVHERGQPVSCSTITEACTSTRTARRPTQRRAPASCTSMRGLSAAATSATGWRAGRAMRVCQKAGIAQVRLQACRVVQSSTKESCPQSVSGKGIRTDRTAQRPACRRAPASHTSMRGRGAGANW